MVIRAFYLSSTISLAFLPNLFVNISELLLNISMIDLPINLEMSSAKYGFSAVIL